MAARLMLTQAAADPQSATSLFLAKPLDVSAAQARDAAAARGLGMKLPGSSRAAACATALFNGSPLLPEDVQRRLETAGMNNHRGWRRAREQCGGERCRADTLGR